MKLKERLIPEIVVEIDGNEIPIYQINEFLDVISVDGGICFDSCEETLADILVKLDIIYIRENNSSKYISDKIFSKSNKFDEFQANFYELYNKMDRTQLSRERKLKELTL